MGFLMLDRIYKQSKYYQVRQRAHCIQLTSKGYKISELMKIFKVSRNTIYNWLNSWESSNLVGLYNQPGRGRKKTFNSVQEQQKRQEKKGEIEIRYLDESGFCLIPYIPDAWQEKNEKIEIKSQQSKRLNV